MSVNSPSLALPGLSGYDFSSIVETLVTSYSQPLTNMMEKESSLEIRQNAWRDVNTRLSSLEKTLAGLQSAAAWSGTSASSGNTEIISATGSSGAVQGTYNIKVIQAALARTAVSEVQVVSDSSATTLVSAGTFRITSGDKTADISVEAGASLKDIADSINNAQTGVSASVIQVQGGYRLAVMSKQTGTENAATFSEVSGTALHQLGIIKVDETLNVSQEARNALLEINGVSNITSSGNTITSAIPGVTLTVNSEDPGTTVTVKVSASYADAQSAVQSFVDQYNSVMNFIETKLSYNKDTKVKGDLYADPALQAIQSRLRQMVSNEVNNPTEPFKISADIGITTSSDNYGKSAVLTFDTNKFNEAMKENSNSVANLFGARAGGVDPVKSSTSSQQAQGLANIMEEYLHPMVMYGGTLAKAQETYSDQVDDLKKQIEEFTIKIASYQERTRLKFSNLETQLASISSQSDWLTAMVKSMASYGSDEK